MLLCNEKRGCPGWGPDQSNERKILRLNMPRIFQTLEHLLRQGLILVSMACVFAAPAAATGAVPINSPALPAEFGEIIFHREGENLQQVYIIGQSHRSSQTGLNGSDTVRVQSEIYRIGEWLIREKGVGLLLPEGFFQKTPKVPQAAVNREAFSFDNPTLHQKLADTRRFVNADMLLNASYNIRLAQVEDEVLYHNVSALLRQVRSNSLTDTCELELVQEKRTAAMLQNIPDAVENAFRCGEIDNRKAMFTIGMAHMPELLGYLAQGAIHQPASATSPDGQGDLHASLRLLEQGYGVTVILPRTLAETYPKRLLDN